MSSKKAPKRVNTSSILIKIGLGILALSFCLLVFLYYPVIFKEVSYSVKKPEINKQIVAVDSNFSIVIPKIGANSKVIDNVDPYNSQEYQIALTKGVAHAKGTALPGEVGNSFYFAHSSESFFYANRFNSVFYLLSKMNKGDLFYLVYNKQIFKYEVTEVKIVPSSDITYHNKSSNKKIATLMTCWPAGLDINRLLVIGNLASVN